MPHLSYLILNESTLFYLDLSASKTNEVGKIHDWTAQVAEANLPVNKNSKAPVGTGTATSTTAFRVERTTTSSSAVVTQAVPTKKKAKSKPVTVDLAVSAFLDDEDETAERDAARTSPIKGRQRLTSKVRHYS